MIKLTGEDGKPVYIAPEHITAVNRHEAVKTFVSTTDGGFVVLENPEEVTRKILGYRLAMQRLNTALLTDRKEPALDNYHLLKRLAGLEDNP